LDTKILNVTSVQAAGAGKGIRALQARISSSR
jgi:hypothetical protein